jgi:hypothetical protein
MVFIEVLKKWRYYVLDRSIITQTDSKFMEHTNTQTVMTNRLARW